jgi:Fe-S-cluster containining protein
MSGMQPAKIDAPDEQLIQIVDAAMAEAARRAGPWLVCRLGCTQCCIGPFHITQLDASRLRRGLADLETADSERAHRIRTRAREYVARVSPDFPGDPATGILDESEEGERRFEAFADDEPCPALDPETGACDLYSVRPLTCRTFGPPVRADANLVVCELCFDGASDADIESCVVDYDADGLEAALDDHLARTTGAVGRTIVAFCLAS